MVDLHCHILSKMDDGPSEISESLQLVQMQIADHVNKIAVTPHFNFERGESIREFDARRKKAAANLRQAITAENINAQIITGAEVFLSPEMVTCDEMGMLAYEGTNYILTELDTRHYYNWVPKVLYEIKLKGYTPVLAHIERYGALLEKKDEISDLINAGTVIQVNAGAVAAVGHRIQKTVFELIDHHFVHLIASDCHSVNHRPPMLAKAFDIIRKKYGNDLCTYFGENSESITANAEIAIQEEVQIKKRRFFHFFNQ